MKVFPSKELNFLLTPKKSIPKTENEPIKKRDIIWLIFKISFAFGLLISFSSMGYGDFWVILDGAICWSFLPLLVLFLSWLIIKKWFKTPYNNKFHFYKSLLVFSVWIPFVLCLSCLFFITNFWINTPNPISTHILPLRIAWLLTSSFIIYHRFLLNYQLLSSTVKALIATFLFEFLLISFIIGFFFFSDQLMPRILTTIN